MFKNQNPKHAKHVNIKGSNIILEYLNNFWVEFLKKYLLLVSIYIYKNMQDFD
jgi:hypothetical protein